MKKLYTLALGLALGAFGFSANAAVTSEEWWSEPENGVVSQEAMEELVYGYEGGPIVGWGGGEPLYVNPDSGWMDYENDDAIDLIVYVNDEYYNVVVATIDYMDYDGVRGFSTLNIQLGATWLYLLEDVEYGTIPSNFTLSIPIPEGCLFVGEDGGDVNGEVNLEYTFENFGGESGGGDVPTVEYLDKPEVALVDGNTLFLYWDEELEVITGGRSVTVQMAISIPNVVGGQYYPQVQMYLTNFSGLEEGQTAPYNDNALMLDFAPLLAQYGSGSYSFQLPASVVVGVDSDKVNEEERWSGNLEFVMPTIIVPESVTYSPDGITITFEENIAVNSDEEMNILIYDTVNGDEIVLSPEDVEITENSAFLPFGDLSILDDTILRLEVPEGFFLVGDDAISAPIEESFDLSITGVAAIELNNVNAPVYNLQGVKVGNSLNGLSNGIYIVNGKKVLVK